MSEDKLNFNEAESKEYSLHAAIWKEILHTEEKASFCFNYLSME